MLLSLLQKLRGRIGSQKSSGEVHVVDSGHAEMLKDLAENDSWRNERLMYGSVLNCLMICEADQVELTPQLRQQLDRLIALQRLEHPQATDEEIRRRVMDRAASVVSFWEDRSYEATLPMLEQLLAEVESSANQSPASNDVIRRTLPCLMALLLSLSGCADMFFHHDDPEPAREALNSAGSAARGAASVFHIGNRARVVEGQPERLCAGELNSDKGHYLCAVRQPSGETEWRLGGGAMQEIPLGSMGSAGESVADFEIDRHWNYLVVVTAEEGHPFLAVYDLNRWLATLRQPDALMAVNPYPGGLHLRGWENNSLLTGVMFEKKGLRFDSDGPVLEGEDAASNDFPLFRVREFRVCLPDSKMPWQIELIEPDNEKPGCGGWLLLGEL